ncbi:hypothetical protein GALMADRAFT_371661 [Galerina marginata CBS 339.88]|uniref:FAM86 N-terminal domain-containing protein n=1 Tax=Galerina marginata (strain CBS 339.88) TaxID=685588 RepID=A0A067U2G1_GALM3|nr:hypothetical protein GALMADRAFT_371661 [Galerina marginata CBS 339.88]
MDFQLFNVLRSFSSLAPPNTIQFPKNFSPKSINDFLLHNILLNYHFQTYPPSQQYQKRFWKWAIENLEALARERSVEELDNDFEIDPRIYNHYLAVMAPSGPATGSSGPSTRSQICGKGLPLQVAPPAQTYITHFWNLETRFSDLTTSESKLSIEDYQSTTLLESRTTIESGTTGLRTWLASFVLAQYLILHPEITTSKRVLELGSGIGFLGSVVASLQLLSQSAEKSPQSSSPSLWLTDINNEVLSRCRDNVNLPCNMSSSHQDVNYLKLDWSESIEAEQSLSLVTLIHKKIDPEIILGADVIFDPSLILPLVGTLKIALQSSDCSRKSKVALIALTVRNDTTVNKFLNHVQELSLPIQELEAGFNETFFSDTVEAHSSCESVKLFRITSTS